MSEYEKKSLVRFLSIYIISLFLLILVIAFLVFKLEYSSLKEMQKYKMQNYAFKISSYIVSAHMMNIDGLEYKKELLLKSIPFDDEFAYGLYDENQNPLKTDIDIKNVLFLDDFYEKNNSLYLVDKSANMHLGVKYIVIKENAFEKKIKLMKKNIFMVLLFSMITILAVGFFLARLFLKPIRDEISRIDRFIKDTTHELNTPVSALIMSISALKKLNIDEKTIKRIAISAKRVSDIYNDLTYLSFKDLSAKKIEPINLKTLIQNRVEYFGDFARMKKIEFILNLEDEIYKIDKESALRLIDNLISNAIKYNKIGGSITITLSNKVLVVEDTGIGIDEKNQKDVFKRYKRVDEIEGGFGIGLDIVASICRDYDIKITLKSQKNKGSIFKLYF